jgi:hypothetical protein
MLTNLESNSRLIEGDCDCVWLRSSSVGTDQCAMPDAARRHQASNRPSWSGAGTGAGLVFLGHGLTAGVWTDSLFTAVVIGALAALMTLLWMLIVLLRAGIFGDETASGQVFRLLSLVLGRSEPPASQPAKTRM